MKSSKQNILISALFFMLLLLTGCSDFTLLSHWKDRDIVIDGKDTEWQDSMVQVGHFYLGVANDADYLYICMSITDKITKAQIMGVFEQEFTVSFSTQEKMTNSFGLRFSNDSPEMDETLIKRLKYLKTQSFQKIAEEMMNNLVIEFTENENPIATLEEAKGVDVAAGMSLNGRKLTYEFKIPLTRSEAHPYAICANPGKPIYVSFRTSELDPDFLAKEMGGGNGGQNPGMHAGMGGRGRGRTMAEELEPFSYVKMLGKIQLAGANRS